MDDAIIRHIRNVYNLMIGEPTAEEIKLKMGSVRPIEPEMRMEVRGRDLIGGMPKTIDVTSEEIREALAEPVRQIAEKIVLLLEETPPELGSDIVDRGIILTGGGALLRGMDKMLHQMTDIPVHIAENPLSCVAIGTGRALEQIDAIRMSGAVSTLN